MFVPAWPGLGPEHLQAAPGRSLPFPLDRPGTSYYYRARNALYHLTRALGLEPGQTVLVPDYHSGNEVAAIRAAGAAVRGYPIGRDLRPDLDALDKLCRAGARALLTIHFCGWPQPVEALVDLCRAHGMLLIEDCALAFLSEVGGEPLGSFGDWAVFCLYKTLPIPNGAALIDNRERGLGGASSLCRPGRMSVAGRTAELVVSRLRGRAGLIGHAVASLKWTAGRLLDAARIRREPLGDIGFDLGSVDLAMSPLSRRLLAHLDYEIIRERRRSNYLALATELAGRGGQVFEKLPDGVCPLFFPCLVDDKPAAARALWAQGIEAVELWNFGDPVVDREAGPDARFLRAHVLELPIHQDVTSDQLAYMAEQVVRLGV